MWKLNTRSYERSNETWKSFSFVQISLKYFVLFYLIEKKQKVVTSFLDIESFTELSVLCAKLTLDYTIFHCSSVLYNF